ncbi:uncharacterized protein LOC144048730 [Vanacampus margaritifer]
MLFVTVLITREISRESCFYLLRVACGPGMWQSWLLSCCLSWWPSWSRCRCTPLAADAAKTAWRIWTPSWPAKTAWRIWTASWRMERNSRLTSEVTVINKFLVSNHSGVNRTQLVALELINEMARVGKVKIEEPVDNAILCSTENVTCAQKLDMETNNNRELQF